MHWWSSKIKGTWDFEPGENRSNPLVKKLTMEVKGLNVETGVPTSTVINDEEIREAGLSGFLGIQVVTFQFFDIKM